MEKGSLIGAGRTAEIFDWDGGRALKLYRDGFPRDWVRHEAELGRTVHAAGLPCPRVDELIEVEGRLGFVCERVPGRSLRGRITSRPWLAGWAGRELARLHLQVHAVPLAGSLPRLRGRIADAVREVRKILGDDTDRVLAALDALPDRQALCHYDFHPDNVLGDGEGARIIDWANACTGAPAADVARTLVILGSPYLPPDFPFLLRGPAQGLKRWLAAAYQAEYRRRSGVTRAEIEAWFLPLAAARLWERVPGEQEWLLGIVRRGVKAC